MAIVDYRINVDNGELRAQNTTCLASHPAILKSKWASQSGAYKELSQVKKLNCHGFSLPRSQQEQTRQLSLLTSGERVRFAGL